MIPLSYSLKSLTVRRGATAATAIGIGLVVFVLASAMMLVAGIKRTLSTSGHADTAIVLRAGASNERNSSLPLPVLSTIMTKPGILREGSSAAAVGEFVRVVHLEKRDGSGFAYPTLRLTTEEGMRFRPEVRVVAGRAPRPGSDEVMIGNALRNRFKGLNLGESMVVQRKSLPVVGIFESGGSSYESEIWGDRDTISAMFRRQGMLSSIRVRLASPGAFDGLRTAIESDKALGLEVERETTFYEKQSGGLAIMFGILGGGIAVLASVGAIIGAMITMYSAVGNRQKEIGTLRVLGFSRGNILFAVLFEAIVLTTMGGALGAVASLGMTYVRFSAMNVMTFSEIVLSFEPSVNTIVTAVVMAAVLGMLGGFVPAVRASRIPIVAALRAT